MHLGESALSPSIKGSRMSGPKCVRSGGRLEFRPEMGAHGADFAAIRASCRRSPTSVRRPMELRANPPDKPREHVASVWGCARSRRFTASCECALGRTDVFVTACGARRVCENAALCPAPSNTLSRSGAASMAHTLSCLLAPYVVCRVRSVSPCLLLARLQCGHRQACLLRRGPCCIQPLVSVDGVADGFRHALGSYHVSVDWVG